MWSPGYKRNMPSRFYRLGLGKFRTGTYVRMQQSSTRAGKAYIFVNLTQWTTDPPETKFKRAFLERPRGVREENCEQVREQDR